MRSIVDYTQLPYVFFGDFYEIMSMNEKEGGALRDERDIVAFRKFVDDCNLVDLGFYGNCFTWCRGKSKSTFVHERVDCFLASPCWAEVFPGTNVRHFSIFRSDHAPLMLCSESRSSEDFNDRLFRFESF